MLFIFQQAAYHVVADAGMAFIVFARVVNRRRRGPGHIDTAKISAYPDGTVGIPAHAVNGVLAKALLVGRV